MKTGIIYSANTKIPNNFKIIEEYHNFDNIWFEDQSDSYFLRLSVYTTFKNILEHLSPFTYISG